VPKNDNDGNHDLIRDSLAIVNQIWSFLDSQVLAILSTMFDQTLLVVYPEFTEIASGDMDRIFENAQTMSIPQDTVLCNENTACEQFFLLLNGSIRVFQPKSDGREVTYYRLQPGDICMMSLYCLVNKRPFTAVAEAETDVRILTLSHDDFDTAMGISSVFRNLVISKVSDRFMEVFQLIQGTVFNNLDMRLACLLGQMFERNKTAVLNVTHQVLANELGTSREVVSRVLKDLERRGCLSLHRGEITLTSPETLRQFEYI